MLVAKACSAVPARAAPRAGTRSTTTTTALTSFASFTSFVFLDGQAVRRRCPADRPTLTAISALRTSARTAAASAATTLATGGRVLAFISPQSTTEETYQ